MIEQHVAFRSTGEQTELLSYLALIAYLLHGEQTELFSYTPVGVVRMVEQNGRLFRARRQRSRDATHTSQPERVDGQGR